MIKKRRGIDPMISMINVVFLLIAFFLFGELDAPAPSAVALPQVSATGELNGRERLIIHADGRLEMNNMEDEAALEQAAQAGEELLVSVDKALPAAQLVEILATLKQQGILIANMEVAK